MFLYWDGYEIDGSDTDFDIVLPEIKEVADFVDCFLSIPLFGTNKPVIYYNNRKNGEKKSADKKRLLEQLAGERQRNIRVNCSCLVMDELPDSVQQQLYAFSGQRKPHEEAYGKVEQPCMSPVSQENDIRGGMTVSLTIYAAGTKKSWYTEEGSIIEGYVYHESLMRRTDIDYPCFSINVGPSFYYEYAVFIIEYLHDHFPGMAVAGGLDCEGGWTFGCTYASSIYYYEKIQIPVAFSPRNTLKRLSEYDIFSSYRHYYHKNWIFDKIKGFRMVNQPKGEEDQEYILSFSDYLSLVEKTLSEPALEPFHSVSVTAAHIMLPLAERFEKAPKAEQRLRRAFDGAGKKTIPWDYIGYMAFTVADGKPVCEFRVYWKLKQYFLTLLELMESGEIDYIKKETYEKRQKDDC